MGDRQPQLSGAYYGPPIPPPGNYYHHYGPPRRESCCSDCLGSCCCSILSTILQILISIITIVGIAALILWLILRPNIVTFRVAEAELNQFNFDDGNNLHYNLSLNFAIRNPNRKIVIYYDQFEARGYYGGKGFGSANTPPFEQGHKNTSVVGVVLDGMDTVPLSDDGRREMIEDRTSGIYGIRVELKLKTRFGIWILKSWEFKPTVRCDLKVPLRSSNPQNGITFKDTECLSGFFLTNIRLGSLVL